MKKSGRGNKSNSALWTAAYDEAGRRYVAMLQFSSASGGWQSLYEISREAFERAGTFDGDDYKTERMIRKGKLLYKYENDRNCPEPTEIIRDDDYLMLIGMLEEQD